MLQSYQTKSYQRLSKAFGMIESERWGGFDSYLKNVREQQFTM